MAGKSKRARRKKRDPHGEARAALIQSSLSDMAFNLNNAERKRVDKYRNEKKEKASIAYFDPTVNGLVSSKGFLSRTRVFINRKDKTMVRETWTRGIPGTRTTKTFRPSYDPKTGQFSDRQYQLSEINEVSGSRSTMSRFDSYGDLEFREHKDGPYYERWEKDPKSGQLLPVEMNDKRTGYRRALGEPDEKGHRSLYIKNGSKREWYNRDTKGNLTPMGMESRTRSVRISLGEDGKTRDTTVRSWGGLFSKTYRSNLDGDKRVLDKAILSRRSGLRKTTSDLTKDGQLKSKTSSLAGMRSKKTEYYKEGDLKRVTKKLLAFDPEIDTFKLSPEERSDREIRTAARKRAEEAWRHPSGRQATTHALPTNPVTRLGTPAAKGSSRSALLALGTPTEGSKRSKAGGIELLGLDAPGPEQPAAASRRPQRTSWTQETDFGWDDAASTAESSTNLSRSSSVASRSTAPTSVEEGGFESNEEREPETARGRTPRRRGPDQPTASRNPSRAAASTTAEGAHEKAIMEDLVNDDFNVDLPDDEFSDDNRAAASRDSTRAAASITAEAAHEKAIMEDLVNGDFNVNLSDDEFSDDNRAAASRDPSRAAASTTARAAHEKAIMEDLVNGDFNLDPSDDGTPKRKLDERSRERERARA